MTVNSRLNQDRTASRRGRSTSAIVFTIFVVGALAALGGWQLLGSMGDDSADDQGVLTHVVGRGDMLITVTDDGTLESGSNVDVKCEVAGGATILWIIPDGTEVEAGEKLVELDPSAITDQLNIQKSVYEKALATKIQSEQNLAAAEIAVREYREGMYLQSLQTAEAQIQIAQQNLSSAQNTLEFTEKMVRKGFATPLQVEADSFAVDRAQLDLDAAITAKRVLEDFTYEKTDKQLVAAQEAAAAQLRADTATLSNEEDHLKHLEKQLTRCVIYAPTKGMVIYANENRSRWGNSDPDIFEGATVRERQAIIRLPDLKNMLVNTTVHESKVNQIHPGLPARIIIQGKAHTGRVVSIANQPEAQGFLSANVKEYGTKVAIDGSAGNLKPGMTAQVEILIAEIKDAVTLPVTAVVEKASGFKCYVKTGKGYEERELKLGQTNDTYIEILDGVKEGDIVVRNPRAVVPSARDEVPAEQRTSDRGQFGEANAAPSSATDSAPASQSESGDDQPAAPRTPSAAQIIEQSDKDGDGKLSKDEVQGPMADYFDVTDSDKDGFISSSELTAAFSRMRSANQQGGQPGAPSTEGAESRP